ncbi:hypothetical protein FACS1894187_14900 [Synergistales bacterium]|nr:hypothetical protein FACS1894187_14900 [Synergistales bacterium]
MAVGDEKDIERERFDQLEKARVAFEKHKKQEVSFKKTFESCKNKGNNYYSDIVFRFYDDIERLYLQGNSLYKIFRFLATENVFEENANDTNFARTFRREMIRRRKIQQINSNSIDVFQSAPVGKQRGETDRKAEKNEEKKILQETSAKQEYPKERKDVITSEIQSENENEWPPYDKEGRKLFIYDGKKVYVNLNDPEDLLPDFIKLRKKLENPDSLRFGDYPDYIQNAMEDSQANGRSIADRETHKAMIAEWVNEELSKFT